MGKSKKLQNQYFISFWQLGILGLQIACFYIKMQGALFYFPYLYVLMPWMFFHCISSIFLLFKLVFTDQTARKAYQMLIQLFIHCLIFIGAYMIAEILDQQENYDFFWAFVPLFAAWLLMCCQLTVLRIQLMSKGDLLTTSSFWTSVVAPLSNLVLPSLQVCSSSGVCSTFGASVVTSLFSAFGLSATAMTGQWMTLGLTLFFVLISIFTLYLSAPKNLFSQQAVWLQKLTYGPFLTGCIAGVIIIFCQFDQLIGKQFSLYGILIGNTVMICAALINYKKSRNPEWTLLPK